MQGPKHAELPHRRSGASFAWSIGRGDSESRASSVSLPHAEWQLAQLSVESEAEGNVQPLWWEKVKALGGLIVSRLKGGPGLC